jgi:DNA polymerase-3 subunit epsilon
MPVIGSLKNSKTLIGLKKYSFIRYDLQKTFHPLLIKFSWISKVMRLAFVDIETTGSRATRDRITEIAIKIWEEGVVIGSWQSLLDPEVSIPPFIQSLTGITNELVKAAPVFRELAETVDELTKDCIFVAHNARFDYGFIKSEFRRLNKTWNRRVLCTVKLAKALYPEFKRHGLDALIERHQIQIGERHRAMGDVDAMLDFYLIACKEHSEEKFDEAISRQLRLSSLPKGLSEEQVKKIPNTPGVYRFYGENNALLYVGKSINLYQRVMSHFSSDHLSTKEMTIAQSITHLDWTETAGDLGAQLLELKEIKSLNPIYNRRSRASKTLVSIKLDVNADGFLCASLSREIEFNHLDQYYGLYRSLHTAKKALTDLANKDNLCKKLLGLEKASGACFGQQTQTCLGACLNQEDVERYNLRMQIAFNVLQLKVWPYDGMIGIKEKHPSGSWEQMHIIYNWSLIATVDSEVDLHHLLDHGSDHSISFDLDSYKLLNKAIMSPASHLPIIKLGKHHNHKGAVS